MQGATRFLQGRRNDVGADNVEGDSRTPNGLGSTRYGVAVGVGAIETRWLLRPTSAASFSVHFFNELAVYRRA